MRSSQGQAVHLKNYKQPDYWVKTVELDFKLDPEKTIVTAIIAFERNKTTSKNAALVLDGDELTLLSLKLNGKVLSETEYQAKPDSLTIPNLAGRQEFTLEIVTEINPAANTKLMGLYRSGGNFCTQCEAEGFRRITYFPDRPDVLAVYTTRIEADKTENPILLGNGNPVKRGSAGKGRHYAVWHDPHPKPSYLFALVAGNLGSIHKPFKTMSGRKVQLGIYVQKGKEENARYAMDALVRSMKWDEEVFGCEYDLDVFNIVAVPDFNMGAMENKGLNVFNDKYVLGDAFTATDADFANIEAIIGHEYFHNWTGNRITCRDWFQLCLKEGLTVYRDQEFSSDMRSRPVKRIADVNRLRTDQFPEDAGPLAHPVRPASYMEINNFYTATIYEKGAELVRMIATLVGPEKFSKGMALYFRKHDGEAATMEDFISCFEKAARIDLSQFMLWYSQAGTPVLNVASRHDRSKKTLTVEIEQAIPKTPGQSRKSPHLMPLDIALFSKSGVEVQPASVSGIEHQGDVFVLNKRNHKLVFSGVNERSIVSLNRGFTAPVKIDYQQSNVDLAVLAEHETDAFARWEALQVYGTRLICSAMREIKAGKRAKADTEFANLVASLAANTSLDPAFRSALVQLPSEGDIARAIGSNIDPAAIHKAHHLYLKAIGKALVPISADILKETRSTEAFSPDAMSAGKRTLFSAVLRYCVISGDASSAKKAVSVYRRADNMTDRFNALFTITHHHPDKAMREKILKDFYKRYQDNHIIIDKWFAVQAMRPGTGTVSDIKRLMKHADFTFGNPNRLRSLIATFAMANPSAFNAASGTGYRLVADVVKKLDARNPQVAARLLTAFRSYRFLDTGRQKKAEDALQGIGKSSNLSRDVSDILNRTLAK